MMQGMQIAVPHTLDRLWRHWWRNIMDRLMERDQCWKVHEDPLALEDLAVIKCQRSWEYRKWQKMEKVLHHKSSRDLPSLQWLRYGFWCFSKSCHSVHPSYLSSCLLMRSQILFPPMFHVSVLLCIPIPLVLFPIPEPRPWHMPNSCYPDMFSLVHIRSKPHVCSSVWNRHWTPCLNLRTLACPLPKIWGQ